MYHVSEFLNGEFAVVVNSKDEFDRLMTAAEVAGISWRDGSAPKNFVPNGLRGESARSVVIICKDNELTFALVVHEDGTNSWGEEIPFYLIQFDSTCCSDCVIQPDVLLDLLNSPN